MKTLNGGLENINGFTFSAVKCGIKYENRLDLSLIFSKNPCTASGVFTTNRIFAAPVRLCRERINNPVHGILINANNANACTGEEGFNNAIQLTGEIAKAMRVDPKSVLMASTGVIGVQLPSEKIKKSVPELINNLSGENGRFIPKAIMTTDTFPKEIAVAFPASGGEYKIAGTAKGSGMIAPDMATLLAFILTDAPVSKDNLDSIFRRCIARSFNAITIDGDMSTNDSAIILSPASGDPLTGAQDLAGFEEALLFVLKKLAEFLVKDGEGATKYVTVSITGAKSDEDAKKAAKSVSSSLLLKTALFGNDPNWGRIACSAGYSGAEIDEKSLSISINGLTLFSRGKTMQFEKEKLKKLMQSNEISIVVDLGIGMSDWVFYTTDISYDYVKINAEYTT